MGSRTQVRTGLLTRTALGAALVVALLAAFVPAAQARWIRGFSDINTSGDDISVCADEVTIEARLDHLIGSFESFYSAFNPIAGEPYPGNNPTSLPLYGSEADAIARTNSVLDFQIPISFVELTTSSYRFEGQQTLPTPTGFGNGDQLFATAFDEVTLATIGVPLTIGDPVYGCPPQDVQWAILTVANAVKVNAYLPHTIIFDSSAVDGASLAVSGDGGTQDVTYLGSYRNLGFARVNLNQVGLGCDTTTLTLDGVDSDGYPYSGDINVSPFGPACLMP